MPEKKTQHWTDSLHDSVYALYETAREYQLAHRAAQIAVETVNIDRRQLHAGRVGLRSGDGRMAGSRAPHERAVFDLSDVYSRTERELHRRYEEAALLYASGAAWAIRSVQNGHSPALVTFQIDDDGDAVPNLMGIPGLDTYAGGPALDAAHTALVQCAGAAEYGEDLAGRDYVSDHEASAMHDAIDVARGLADAAFAYGLLAQRAVRFVLLEPRRLWHSELAAARAAAQTAQPTT